MHPRLQWTHLADNCFVDGNVEAFIARARARALLVLMLMSVLVILLLLLLLLLVVLLGGGLELDEEALFQSPKVNRYIMKSIISFKVVGWS